MFALHKVYSGVRVALSTSPHKLKDPDPLQQAFKPEVNSAHETRER